MADNELLKYCRYYKGEEESPFRDIAPKKCSLWHDERAFVTEAKNGTIQVYIKDYEAVGLGSFCADDGIPIGLKAMLFNRYSMTSYSQLCSKTGFKEFYLHYYPNEAFFKNYRYYKGELSNSFGDGRDFWWRIEHYALEADDKINLCLSHKMLEYIKHRMWHDGDFGTTTWDEAKVRAEEMYEKGIWCPDYLSRRDAALTDED